MSVSCHVSIVGGLIVDGRNYNNQPPKYCDQSVERYSPTYYKVFQKSVFAALMFMYFRYEPIATKVIALWMPLCTRPETVFKIK
jgi:hypothetical protein